MEGLMENYCTYTCNYNVVMADSRATLKKVIECIPVVKKQQKA